MARALTLAERGRGAVEPNPLVGAVVVRAGEAVGEGHHPRYGEPHAEVFALREAKERARGATLYVTLEPCCHHGKTPPCTKAVIEAGVSRVVCAMADPFPRVAGGGIAELRAAGIAVEVGVCEAEARELNAPYLTLLGKGRPWVIAKWAMSLDGRIATRTGDSKWISGEASRQIVHALRGRVDAVIVGSGTALADDPLLTARPPGPRTAARVVLDRRGRLPLTSKLVRTAREVPVIVVTEADGTGLGGRGGVFDAPESADTPARDSGASQSLSPGHPSEAAWRAALSGAGCEVLTLRQLQASRGRKPPEGGEPQPPGAHAPGSPGEQTPGAHAPGSPGTELAALLAELGRRRMTNVLVEGGAAVLGALFDAGLVDEAWAFLTAKVIGGTGALSPVGGVGTALLADAFSLASPRVEMVGPDVWVRGRVARP